MHPIADIIAPVLGHPSWLVQRGHGSFVTMELGEPKVHVRDPKLRKTYLDGPRRRPPNASHTSTANGTCGSTAANGPSCWMESCWHSESGDLTMRRALNVLSGQKLTAVDIEPADGRTDFTFDLGCSLLTCPPPPGIGREQPDEQWKLYLRSGPVLVVRSDPSYMICDRHQKPADCHWLPISYPVSVHA